MDFQRARSQEQRAQRRQAILDVAAGLLSDLSVADLSLNELSRHVGLAKSNVLRYFESREAILLELLDDGVAQWVESLRPRVAQIDGDARVRGDQLAALLAGGLAERPVLCDLIAAQAAVLERNISTEVALRHKRNIGESAQRLADLISQAVPELEAADAYQVVVVTLLMASALWPGARPSEALQAAYDADPAVAASRLDFVEALSVTVSVQISGLLARGVSPG